MEARTLLRLVQDYYVSADNPRPHMALLMADFTKAFDRISHPYLSEVLTHMGFGPRIRNLLMLVTMNQQARVFLNNHTGAAFPLKCGVRQGNPVSPILFNFAIEPLLCRLQTALRGVPVFYDDFHLIDMKYHAFADDVNIYMRDADDCRTVAQELRQFQRCSNILVNPDKSMLYGFLSDFAQQSNSDLSYRRNPLWDTGPDGELQEATAPYLGIPLNGVDWTRFIQTLPFMCRRYGYQLLRLGVKSMGTNIFNTPSSHLGIYTRP